MDVSGRFAIKRPCGNCPFRNDVPRYLSPGRYAQIGHDLTRLGHSFTCHKTIDYDRREEEGGDGGGHVTGDRERQCAGAMIWLNSQKRPNQMMQVMERLGIFDPSRLDMAAPVWKTFGGFVNGVEDAAS